jgi:hypothetical protein
VLGETNKTTTEMNFRAQCELVDELTEQELGSALGTGGQFS